MNPEGARHEGLYWPKFQDYISTSEIFESLRVYNMNKSGRMELSSRSTLAALSPNILLEATVDRRTDVLTWVLQKLEYIQKVSPF